MDRAWDSAGDVDGAVLVHNIPVSIQGHSTRMDEAEAVGTYL